MPQPQTTFHFIVSTAIDAGLIAHRIGFPEYSYFFVLEDFIPLLSDLGRVTRVTDAKNEVDALYKSSQELGEKCIFLNFTAPQNLISDIQCPTAHVFAWEFNTLPTETWLEDGLQDWRAALAKHSCAITHSHYAKKAITDEMGFDFNVAVIPSPVWNKFDDERAVISDREPIKSTYLHFHGRLFDTKQLELFMEYDAFQKTQQCIEVTDLPPTPKVGDNPGLHRNNPLKDLLRAATPPILWQPLSRLYQTHIREQSQKTKEENALVTSAASQKESINHQTEFNEDDRPNAVRLDGVIYTSIFNPLDGRKNWRDMVSAFIWANKSNKDATLIIKAPKLDVDDFINPLIDFLKRFIPFDCRVIVIKAFLNHDEYRTLMEATTYYINTSYGEGQCLPLMEYLSAGIPAIAPDSTALADYINADIAFVIKSHAEPSTWQHDPRLSYRALRYRIDWMDLVKGFEESYRLAKTDSNKWRDMGHAAGIRMESHASIQSGRQELRRFLDSAFAV
ncbi:MAG: glycosyltransferase [Pseudomonadota bacterium]